MLELRHARKPRTQLSRNGFFGNSRISLVESLSNAEHRSQPASLDSRTFQRALLVFFPEDVASLRVPDQYEPRSSVAGNRNRDLASECALIFPVDILHAEQDVSSIAKCSCN